MDTDSCCICCKRVQYFCVQILCENCKTKCHVKCVNLEREDLEYINNWFCPKCVESIFPFNHFHDNEDFYGAILEELLDCSYQYHIINQRIFNPFEVNDDHEYPLTEIDPDIQFYLNSHYLKSTKCDYYHENSFNKHVVQKINQNSEKKESHLSLFHTNIKSLSKHFDELELYLESLNYNFSFIGLTETWLNDNNCDLFARDNYESINRYRKHRIGGGVSLYIKQDIKYKSRSDLECFDTNFETLFVEVDKSSFLTNSNIIVGVIYRMPGTPLNVFNEYINGVLNIIAKEKKLCYLMGDYNADLLKHESDSHTSDLLDIMYSNSMFPVISKPTRVTDLNKTATLIDHIYTNNFEQDHQHVQGILCTAISDHFSIFHIAVNSKAGNNYNTHIIKRDMKQSNITKFKNEMSLIEWGAVLAEHDAQNAYTMFHNTISNLYNRCFPCKKINAGYTNRKPWLSMALKESIKVKNKLYITRNKGPNAHEKCKYYKKYRNKLNKLLVTAERKYYSDLLEKHRSNLKKSWQILTRASVPNEQPLGPNNH